MDRESFPPQGQDKQPGVQKEMTPKPQGEALGYKPAGKLLGKRAIVTGGDSGIGRAVAIMFALEGADVAIVYLDETEDARETLGRISASGRRGLLFAGDVGSRPFCERVIEETVQYFGGLDILVNNAGEQHVKERLEDIEDEQIERTFRTNIFSQFYLTRAALKHLGPGSSVINTASVTAYSGHPLLLDYSSTKGAIVAFTRSLSLQLAPRGIRVNAVAPGPIWTPLIPAQDSFTPEMVEKFGKSTPLGRAGQPDEVAPCYVFLASSDASCISGQVLHPNGGQVLNG